MVSDDKRYTIMASSNFTIAPSTGTGNGTITVTPRSTNTAHSDKKTRVTITNAGRTAEADIIQYGIPSITLLGGSTTLPSNGGTLAYSIYSRYPFGFTNKPDWVTVYDGYGNYYSSNAEISPSLAGRTFYIEVGNWDREMDRRTDDYLFAFSYKKVEGGSWDSNSTLFGIVQQGSSSPDPDYLNVSPLFLVFDFDSTSNKEVTVDASSTAWTVTNTSGNFTATKSNGKLLIRPLSTNAGSTKLSGSITIGLNGLSQTISVSQYSHPRIVQNGGYDTSVPMEGGNKYVQVTSDYQWWFLPLPIPDYITIYNENTEQHLSYYYPYDPSSTGVRQPIFTFTWDENTTDDPRVDSFYLGIIDAQGDVRTFGRDIIRFTQRNSPTRIHIVRGPGLLRVGNAAGTQRPVTVFAYNCSWMFSDIPNYITLTDENGNAVSGWQTGDGTEHIYTATWAALSSNAEPREWLPMILWKYTEGGDEVTGRDYALEPYTQYPYAVAPSFMANDNYDIPYYGGQISFDVCSDYQWYWSNVPSYVADIFDEDGNSAYYTSSNKCTDLGTTHTYYWVINPNTGSTARTFRAKMSYEDGGSTITLDSGSNFRQGIDGEIYPSILTVDPEVGMSDVTVAFDATPWSYSIDNAGQQFLTVIQAETDLSYSRFIIRYSENTGSAQRIGTITFTDHNGSTKTLEVRQRKYATYVANPNPVQAAATAASYTVQMVMDDAWTYRANDSWISVTTATTSAGNGYMTLSLTANETLATRVGSVSIKVNNIEVLKVTVQQVAAAAESISVKPNVFYLAGDRENVTLFATVDSTIDWVAQSSDERRVGLLTHTGGTGSTQAAFYVQNNPYDTTQQEYIYYGQQVDVAATTIVQYPANYDYPFEVLAFDISSGGTRQNNIARGVLEVPANSSGPTYYLRIKPTRGSVYCSMSDTWLFRLNQQLVGDEWNVAFYVMNNNTGKNRTGYISIVASDGTGQMVTIRQSAT